MKLYTGIAILILASCLSLSAAAQQTPPSLLTVSAVPPAMRTAVLPPNFVVSPAFRTLRTPASRICAAPADADNPDKGLQHRFHVAVGITSLSNTGGDSSTSSGLAAKIDWSYFRPTRHEAVATLWFVNASGSNAEALTTEYRWRFGGHGIAYYALGLGVATGSGLQSGVFTEGFGVDLGRFTLELRGLGSSTGVASMFLVGARF